MYYLDVIYIICNLIRPQEFLQINSVLSSPENNWKMDVPSVTTTFRKKAHSIWYSVSEEVIFTSNLNLTPMNSNLTVLTPNLNAQFDFLI